MVAIVIDAFNKYENPLDRIKWEFDIIFSSYDVVDTELYKRFIHQSLDVAPKFISRGLRLEAGLNLGNHETGDLIQLLAQFPCLKFYPVLEYSPEENNFGPTNDPNSAYSFLLNSIIRSSINRRVNRRMLRRLGRMHRDGTYRGKQLVDSRDVRFFCDTLMSLSFRKRD